MKKLSLLAIILFISIGEINAQEVSGKLSATIARNVPDEVLAAIAAENPGLYRHPHLIASAEEVNGNKHSKWPLQRFHVYYKGRDYRKNAVYDKRGNLLWSRENIRNVVMPDAVIKSILRKYKDWRISETAVVKKIKTGTSDPRPVVYYKVQLQNGKKKQRKKLNEHGEIFSRKSN